MLEDEYGHIDSKLSEKGGWYFKITEKQNVSPYMALDNSF